MRLTPPTKAVFYLSVIFAAVGIVANLVTIPVLTGLAFWIVVVGYVLLFLGVAVKGF